MAPRYDPIRDAAPSSSRSPQQPSQPSASPDSASVRSHIGSGDSLNRVRRGSAAGGMPEGRYDTVREGINPGHSMERHGSHPGNGVAISPRSSITGSPSQHYQAHPHYHQQQLHRPSSSASSDYPNPSKRGASIHDLITASEIASVNQAAAAGRHTALSRSYSHQSDEAMEHAPAAGMSRSNSNSSQHYGYHPSQQSLPPQVRTERSPSMVNLLNEGTAGAVHERPRSGSQSSVSSMLSHSHSHPQLPPHPQLALPHSHHAGAQTAPPAPPSSHHMLGHGHPSREALMHSRQRPGSSSASWGKSPPMAAPPLPAVPRTSSSPAMGPAHVAHIAGERARIFPNPAMVPGSHPRSLSASYGYASVSSSPGGGVHQALHPSPTPQFVVPGLPAHRSPEARRNMPLPPSPSNVPMMPNRAPVTPSSNWAPGVGPGGAYIVDDREGGYPVSSPRRISVAHPMAARFAPPTPGNGIPHTPGSLPPTPGGLPPTPGSRSMSLTTPGFDPRHAEDYFERRGHEYPDAHHQQQHSRSFSNTSYADEHERRMSVSAARRPSVDISHLTGGSPASMIAASPNAESYRGAGPPPLPPVASSPLHGMLQTRRESLSHEAAPSAAFDPVRGVDVSRRPSSSSRSIHSNTSSQMDPRRISESSAGAREAKESPVSDGRASGSLLRSVDGPGRDSTVRRISILDDGANADGLEARRRNLQMEARIKEEERERSEAARTRESVVMEEDYPAREDKKLDLAPAKDYPPSYRQNDTETISPRTTPQPKPRPASPSPPPAPRDEEMRPPTPKSVTPPQKPSVPAPLKYAPQKRLSPPKMVMRPISMQEIVHKRGQCRNTLRLEWERENCTNSREPLDRILIEHQKLAANGSSNAGVQSPKSALKRKEEELLKDADEVAHHYNKRREVGIQGREESPIFGLRKFNNWIKSVMIGSFARGRDPSMDNRGRPRGGRILDLGCGKGGDLKKWDKVDPSALVGVDIAAISIEQATQRHRDSNFRFTAEFFAFDCFSRPLTDVVPRPLLEPMFDSVSLQFCMHYAWENVQKARVMLENVSKYLRRGGTFIGTIPDSVILKSRLERSRTSAQDRSFGNRYYKVVFDDVSRFPPFGNRYTFFLEDAVENVPEYVVEWTTFESLAHENGLRCIYRRNFADIYEEEARKPEFGKLLERMKVVDRGTGRLTMDSRMWEAATLYMGFAFEKV